MVSRSERIILAAVVSLTSFCFSFYWYKYGRKTTQQRKKAEAIAVLESSSSIVQRKPAKRVIWQEIAPGDLLFSKEAIRTPSNASAEIVFLEGKTKIELEPDSVIVLEKTTGDVALNFLKGNVFVAGGENSGLKIKSGDSVVEAGSGEINLSRQKGEGLELQVLKGNAKLNANGKSVELGQNQIGTLSEKGIDVEKDLIQIASPESNSKVFIDFKKKKRFLISWKERYKDYEIHLYAGRSASRLKKSKTAILKRKTKQIEVAFKPGFIYWQLRAEPKKTSEKKDLKPLKSALFKNKVVPIQQPAFVEPQKKQKISLRPQNSQFEFRWTDPMGMTDAKLQVWQEDKNGGTLRGTEKTFDVADVRHVHKFSSSGNYASRITGFLKVGKEKFIPVSSSIIKYQVSISDRLEPPELRAPLDEQKIRYTRARETGLFLSWENVYSSKEYVVKIEEPNKKAREIKVSSNSFQFEKFLPGEYNWSVATIAKDGKRSKFSDVRKFSVTDMPALAWNEEIEKGLSFYIGKEPKIYAGWEEEYPDAVRFRFFYSLQNEWSKKKEKMVDGFDTSEPVSEEGFYEVQVQALNSKGEVLAQTTRKTVNVKPRPLLPAPDFDPSLDSKLEASARGHVRLFWEKVVGAKEYLLRLHKKGDAKGQYKELRTSNLEMDVESLPPGSYKTELYAVDRFERLSYESDQRTIKVDNKSDIRAPSAIKKIKVKGVYRKGR